MLESWEYMFHFLHLLFGREHLLHNPLNSWSDLLYLWQSQWIFWLRKTNFIFLVPIRYLGDLVPNYIKMLGIPVISSFKATWHCWERTYRFRFCGRNSETAEWAWVVVSYPKTFHYSCHLYNSSIQLGSCPFYQKGKRLNSN